MAVTEILGTDSLSSSRITLNDNFVELEDRIEDISNYLDTSAQTITGVSITATQIAVSGTATFTSTQTDDLTVTANTDLQGSVKRTGVVGSVANPVSTLTEPYTANVYFIETQGVQLDIPSSLPSTHGTEILLIATNNNIQFNTGNIERVNQAELVEAGDIVELKAIDDGSGTVKWYVIGGGDNFIA